ncbi:MAG: hypothetical protein R3B90_08440 [Planctomycetaceae bacterium]
MSSTLPPEYQQTQQMASPLLAADVVPPLGPADSSAVAVAPHVELVEGPRFIPAG